jgi:transposase InsO family protein
LKSKRHVGCVAPSGFLRGDDRKPIAAALTRRFSSHQANTPATNHVRGRGIGYDYVLSMVDDHSRLAYSEIHSDEKGSTCAGFIARAAQYFQSQGISSIEQVITDNHFSYRRSSAVAAIMGKLHAKHLFIKPHCPWQNGKVGRCNRTLQSEWSHRRVFASNADRARALAPWSGDRRSSPIAPK